HVRPGAEKQSDASQTNDEMQLSHWRIPHALGTLTGHEPAEFTGTDMSRPGPCLAARRVVAGCGRPAPVCPLVRLRPCTERREPIRPRLSRGQGWHRRAGDISERAGVFGACHDRYRCCCYLVVAAGGGA